jgi:hypothetical protein
MILWTIVPLEEVFSSGGNVSAYEEISYNGVNVLVERAGTAQCRVVRLLTTNPQDFLRADLQPGALLTEKSLF